MQLPLHCFLYLGPVAGDLGPLVGDASAVAMHPDGYCKLSMLASSIVERASLFLSRDGAGQRSARGLLWLQICSGGCHPRYGQIPCPTPCPLKIRVRLKRRFRFRQLTNSSSYLTICFSIRGMPLNDFHFNKRHASYRIPFQ